MTGTTFTKSSRRCESDEQNAAGPGSARLLEFENFLAALTPMRSLCRRHGRPLSIVLLDIDRFRECNEKYSSAFGDRVLRSFCSTLETVCRESDLLARQRSDRFVVALPESRAFEARELVSRFRRAIRDQPLVREGKPVHLAVSAGIAESAPGFIETQQQLIHRARSALEQAKRQGGNRITVWSDLQQGDTSPLDSPLLTVDGVSDWVERLRRQIRTTCIESTRALIAAVEARDPYTEAHSLTVAAYSETIGKRMNLPPRVIDTLRSAALLHDVGKIGVPDAILTKPGPLTEQEFNVIKAHPTVALDILRHVSFLADERPFILHHHERYDGRGYPTGLAGRRIPIGARILAVADALDTMLSPRTYKKPYSLEQATEELKRNAGRQFDPVIVETTLAWIEDSPEDLVRSHPRAESRMNPDPTLLM